MAKILLSPEEGREAIGVGRSTMGKLLLRGEIPSFKIGHLRKIPVDGLRDWVKAQASKVDGDRDEN